MTTDHLIRCVLLNAMYAAWEDIICDQCRIRLPDKRFFSQCITKGNIRCDVDLFFFSLL